MQLRGVFSISCLLFLSVLVSGAGNSTSDQVGDTYRCLEKQITDKPALGFADAVFSTMAIGFNEKAIKVIEQEEKKETEGSCWPKGGCTIKETAQVLLALHQAGRDTKPAERWLTNKNVTATDLAWFLEIDTDAQQPAQCTVTYEGSGKTIRIGADMRITGNPGTCLTISPSGYLLRVRDTCVDKTFEVSCNQSFITTLIYQKDKGTGSDCLSQQNETCFVSGDAHSSSSLGTTQEQIRAQCFKQNGVCTFEGSLWATLALHKRDLPVTSFVPYLLAHAEGNERFFASAFLYSLTGGDDFFSTMINQQRQGSYWELTGSPYNRYYDTAVGLLGLGSSSEAEQVRTYLLGIRTKEGCWNGNRISDTGLLLYAGWPRAGGGSAGTGGDALCEEISTQSCTRRDTCLAGGGRVLDAFECTGFGLCCSIKVEAPTCASQQGTICRASEQCSGRSVDAKEEHCCIGTCAVRSTTTITNVCEQEAGGLCRASCDEGESVSTESCEESGAVCCMPGVTSVGSGMGWLWFFILAIILLLLGIGYVKREALQVWWFSMRKKPTVTQAPRPAPRPGPTLFRPRPGAPVRAPVRPAPRPAPARESGGEFEETLRKLRDMSK